MDPVSTIRSSQPVPETAEAARPTHDFSAALHHDEASTSALDALAAPLRGLESDRRRIHGLLADAMQGRRFSPAELLALQAGVYRLNTELELAAKVVEGTNAAVRRALATEV